MRVIYAVLLAAVVVARVDAFLEATDLAMVKPSANHHEVTLPTKRLLRTQETGDDEYEERAGGIPVSAVEKAKAIITPAASTEKLKTWLNSGKSLDDVFVRLKLDKAKDQILSSPQFTNWLNYADDLTSKAGKEASAIATLTTQYGDEALAKIIIAAKKIEGTKAVATRLEAEQMQSWLAAGSTADDVFKLLKLDKAGDDVLTSPLFNTWSMYMQIFNKENPAKKTTLYATLATHYSDDVLARMVESAKKVKTTAGTAKRVEATQIQSWLGRKQTPDNVFKLLKLDSAGDDVLANPALNTWATYLNTFNKENPDKKTTMIATVTANYGDEGVSRMLDAAKKVETTKSIATNLETAQIQQWLSTGKYFFNNGEVYCVTSLLRNLNSNNHSR
ncbi:hypothetical protein PF010_g25629 [Phytophthora fragariae]|uniref:RxLR effector protein n=1 Tax=Phytophthora fragariae TaxID=53985 RepID=A0A6G0MTX6_9STRA|nr:hypothetical protein PF010_g25629 [Phytophthora fragariae]KAE9179831.1 hypothetical protein PF004_g25021 [Phytophthora fragariae]